jgi:hypothetical protein
MLLDHLYSRPADARLILKSTDRLIDMPGSLGAELRIRVLNGLRPGAHIAGSIGRSCLGLARRHLLTTEFARRRRIEDERERLLACFAALHLAHAV